MTRQGEILSKPCNQINNVTIKPILLEKGAYPLSAWMTKPYAYSPNLTRAEKRFNKKLSSARVSLERAFGLLKARWRCLLKRLDDQIESISEVIIPCFALNNFCQLENEEFIDQDGILDDLIRQERVAKNKKRTKRKSKSTGRRSCTKCHKKSISWKMFENKLKVFLSLLQCLRGSFVKR